MSRTPIAVIAGLLFFTAWVVAAVTLADVPMHWAVRAVYFLVAGFVWVFPIRWLMLWAVHRR